MEQPTDTKTAPDSAEQHGTDELSEHDLLDVLADLDGVKRTPRSEPEPAEPEAQAPVAKGSSGEAEESKNNNTDSPQPEAVDKSEKQKSTPENRDASDSEPPSKQSSKFDREQARLSESWQRLEQEKAIVRQEAQRIQAERQAIENDAIKTIAKNPANSPEELRRFAKEWDEEGRSELADEARKQAEGIEKAQAILKEKNDRELRLLNEERAFVARQAVSEFPELADQNSELRRTAEMLSTYDPAVAKFVASTPKALIMLAHVAQMKMAAESAASLQSEVDKLKNENEQLRKNLSVGESHPSKPSRGRKTFEQMNDREQEDFLRKVAQEADEGLVSLGV